MSLLMYPFWARNMLTHAGITEIMEPVNQADTGRTKLPPTTLSVVVPAMPADFKSRSFSPAKQILALSGVLMTLAVAVPFVVPNPEMRVIALLICAAGLFSAALLAVWRMKKLIAERDDYEVRLQETTYKLVERNSNLKQLVQIDPLTQLLNRRGLERALSVEVSRAKRQKLQMFAVLLDCDDFKAVNETHGHAGGDAVLQNMSGNVVKSIRPTDYASRVGGDEFIVLLVDVGVDEATRIAERIRLNINQYPAEHNGQRIPCTASLGMAELPLLIESIEEVLTLCRQSLTTSKGKGKNAITVTTFRRSSTTSDVT